MLAVCPLGVIAVDKGIRIIVTTIRENSSVDDTLLLLFMV